MLEGLLVGLKTAMSLQNFAMVRAGCLIGTFIGMLSGLGLMSIIANMIPFAISMGDRSAALILLAGVNSVAIFGGSTSSILLNAPGGIMNLHSGLGFIAPVIGRQSIQGFFIGVLSGTGATIASLLGYAVEPSLESKQEPAVFGKGTIKGPRAPRQRTTRPAPVHLYRC